MRLYAPLLAPDAIAPFAQRVTREAGSGDWRALQLLDEGAAALAQLVMGVACRLDYSEGLEVVLLGGCARSGAPYQPRIEQAIRAVLPHARLVEPLYEPRYGAALNALRAAHDKPSPLPLLSRVGIR